MRRHIYDDDIWYSIGLRYVRLATRLCYRRFHVTGKQRIPEDAHVILVSNHSNALMDPLVMLLAVGKKIVFMARADIFRRPFVRSILTWLRILPIYRIRDGYDAVRSNDSAIAQAVDVVVHRTPLCLYPEGTHRTMHSLLRLSKGLFHIALDAHDAGAQPVYIVPVGIEYSDYFRFRADVEVTVGELINVSEFVEDFKSTSGLSPREGEEDEPDGGLSAHVEPKEAFHAGGDAAAKASDGRGRQMNALRERLTQALQDLFTWLPDDEDYDALWELTQLRTAWQRPSSAKESMTQGQREVSRLLGERKAMPEQMKKLCSQALAFKREREARRIDIRSTSYAHPWRHVVGRALLLLVTLPLFALCAALSWPVWLLTTVVARRAHDPAWQNTWRFAVCVILMPLLVITVALIGFSHLSWGAALALTLLAAGSIPFVYDWMAQFRRLCSDVRWLRSPALRAAAESLR